MPEQRTKKYVEVIADFSPEGILTPQTVIWDTGQKFDITCISEVLPRKYSKTGGVQSYPPVCLSSLRTLYLPDRQSKNIPILRSG